MKLAQRFKEIRTRKRLSMGDVVQPCKLDRGVVYRLEHGRHVKAATLRDLCFKGLGLTPKSPEWHELRTLWSAESIQEGIDDRGILDSGELTRHLAASSDQVRKLATLIEALPPLDLIEIRKLIERPKVFATLRHLNSLYETRT